MGHTYVSRANVHNKPVESKESPLKHPPLAEFEPGMILTLSDMKNTPVNANEDGGRGAGRAGGGGDKRRGERRKPAMTLHGPPGLSEFYQATRHFMQRNDFPIGFEAVKVGGSPGLLQFMSIAYFLFSVRSVLLCCTHLGRTRNQALKFLRRCQR